MIGGDSPEMPQNDKPLSTQEVTSIRRWIEHGAAWPAGLSLSDRRFEGQRWWSFAPLVRPKVPALSTSRWVRAPIDLFILDTLARVQFMQGKKEEAIALEEKALKLTSDDHKDAFTRTLDAYKKGELPKAE